MPQAPAEAAHTGLATEPADPVDAEPSSTKPGQGPGVRQFTAHWGFAQ